MAFEVHIQEKAFDDIKVASAWYESKQKVWVRFISVIETEIEYISVHPDISRLKEKILRSDIEKVSLFNNIYIWRQWNCHSSCFQYVSKSEKKAVIAVEYYNYIKALHLIFIITWFAGLFYIPRLFIYHIEAGEKPEPERKILMSQFKLMTRRLWYIITWPSAILATFFAIWLLILVPSWLQQSWMLVKLGFVVLLFAYHFKCHLIFLKLQQDRKTWTSNQMRLWNEGSTVILFAIIFLVIVRDAVNWIFGVIGIFLLAVILMIAVKIYKRLRKKNPDI